MNVANPSLFSDRGIVILIDPDRVSSTEASAAARLAATNGINALWVGGTFLHRQNGSSIVRVIVDEAQANDLPVSVILGLSSADCLLQPGITSVLLPLVGTLYAAGELFRQAYRSTPALAALGVPVIPIGYLAVDGGRISSTMHGLQGTPIPRDKPEIAETLALSCQFTGAQAVYLDAGSGALETVPAKLIEIVRATIHVPLIVGGGIRRPEQAHTALAAGADLVVVGSAFEESTSPSLYKLFGSIARGRR